MMKQHRLVAAVFIGGMESVEDEFEIGGRDSQIRRYLVWAPDGAARVLSESNSHSVAPMDASVEMQKALRSSRLYPWLMRNVMGGIGTDYLDESVGLLQAF